MHNGNYLRPYTYQEVQAISKWPLCSGFFSQNDRGIVTYYILSYQVVDNKATEIPDNCLKETWMYILRKDVQKKEKLQ